LALPAAGVHALTWRYDTSEENNKAVGRSQSFVAGPPKNGVQFMVKDSRKYASDRRLGLLKCKDGKPADEAVHKPVLPATRLSKRALYPTLAHLERPLMKFTKNKEREQ
jgi:hypothetical protein